MNGMMHCGWWVGSLALGLVTVLLATAETNAAVQIEKNDQGGFICKTASYEARLDSSGNLQSLRSGETEFLGRTAAMVHAGQFVLLQKARQTAPDTLVAEGSPKDSAKSFAGSPCPFDARVTYHFNPESIELTLEQSLDQYGGFAWVPSESVQAGRDALTDYAIKPAGPALYGQTDPRWITQEGPVLRFDFGVWQKGFANAYWYTTDVDGQAVHYMQSTVPGSAPIKTIIFPLAHPTPKDALTFDIIAADPDFLMPSRKPVHFDIKLTNAGPDPVQTKVTFEVRAYLTQKPVAAKTTDINLAAKGEMMLPTDLALKTSGPYRGAIVVEESGKSARSFWWIFTYDFANYHPKNTRPPDFKKFWKEALEESQSIPLDIKMTPVPEKSNATFEAFKVSYATLGGRRIYGWYARPRAPGRYPAQIRFPSSGVYPLANPEAAGDRCCLWILIHGFDVDLSNMPQGDDPGKNYWTAGIESPKTSMWRTIYISLVRAVDFMLAQPEVDPKRVAVVGGSQGGGLSMIAAGLDHRIGFCMPAYSGLPRLDWTVKYEPGYWPFGMAAKPKNQTKKQFLKTLSYFDAANFTQDIQCPIAAEVGLMDTVTASGNQVCAFAHVPRNLLYMVCSPWAMHGAGSRADNHCGEYYQRFLQGQEPVLPARR